MIAVRLVLIVSIGLLAVALGGGGSSAAAQEATDNATCLACHTPPGAVMTLPSTEVVSVTVDPERFAASPHGRVLTCATCHQRNVQIPHPSAGAPSLRAYQQRAVAVCATCHADRVAEVASSVHGRAERMGFAEAPLCTTCHNPHDAARVVSGAYRNNIPQLCGSCHADRRLMQKYGLRPVYETYAREFHGVTTTLYKLTRPQGPAPAAVCTDCHGEHEIRAAADPRSKVHPANLLATCRQCHPTAGRYFATAWTEHRTPSPTDAPLVYYVQLFYRILIPATVAFLGLLTALDLGRWAADQLRRAER
ncbi:MAG TPA: cytochrome c3 family protein [bacterium]|nr:cytochrome c3 family protein [bacterium]